MNESVRVRGYANEDVLVTGGAGFVGSNLSRKLCELGANVTVLDDLYTGDEQNLSGINLVELVKGDVRDTKLIKSIAGNFSYVFHLAARNIILSTKNPIEDCSVNIQGTLNILESLRKSKKLKKFLYTSSASIYGNPRYLPIDEGEGFNILTPYAASKLGGENYTKVYYENYGLPTVVVRYSNVYGDFQSPHNPYCGVIGKFIEKIYEGKSPIVHGDGEQTRDFTYIKDAIQATLIAGISEKSTGEVFNIGTGVETSVNKLVELISELFSTDIQPDYIDKRDIDNIRRRVVNIEKIRQRLRWGPSYTMKKGLNNTVNWYIEHKNN